MTLNPSYEVNCSHPHVCCRVLTTLCSVNYTER